MTSQAKYTPGPWHAHINNMIVTGDRGEHRIATVLRYYGASKDSEFHPPEGSPRGNALLIAAAPDLLEKLEQLLDHGQTQKTHDLAHEDSFVVNDLSVINEARAAIAKARGEQAEADPSLAPAEGGAA